MSYNLGLLDNVLAAGKPVIAVEYISGATEVANIKAEAAAAGIGYYIANPNFELDGVDTEGFTSPPCFVRGTLIATPTGESPVETLCAGDLVLTADRRIMPVRWIGRRSLDLTRHPRPKEVSPIRIRGGAFNDDIPRRDLLVSPEHAIFWNNLLIPARLLVNGATIIQDLGARTVNYYHVELEAHAVLLSEGLPAESYLDTGNRTIFENADKPLVLHPDFASDDVQRARETRSCAPFAADEARVEPIWRSVAERAVKLGYTLSEVKTSDDADLRLLVDGREMRPLSAVTGRYTFVLPHSRNGVRLLSRATIPSDVKPWVEDRRRLGVMVRRITLRYDGEVLTIPPDDPILTDGWWAVERDGMTLWRWTNGNAAVQIRAASPVVMEIEVAGTVPYVADCTPLPTAEMSGLPQTREYPLRDRSRARSGKFRSIRAAG